MCCSFVVDAGIVGGGGFDAIGVGVVGFVGPSYASVYHLCLFLGD